MCVDFVELFECELLCLEDLTPFNITLRICVEKCMKISLDQTFFLEQLKGPLSRVNRGNLGQGKFGTPLG